MGLAALILAALALAAATGGVSAEHTQSFRVKEDIPVGTVIGTVGGGEDASSSPTPPPPPPYLIVPVGSAPDRDLIVNSQTGEIRTKRPLDRETTASYALNAIPLSGDSIRVTVEVADINDNTPTFPESEVDVDIPENTPRGTKRKLARVSGNNAALNISSDDVSDDCKSNKGTFNRMTKINPVIKCNNLIHKRLGKRKCS